MRALHPPQDLGWAVQIVLPIAVRPVDLVVVVGDELVMTGDELGPGLGMREVSVRHSPLHVEMSLDMGLPGLLLVNLLFADPECCVYFHPFLRFEGPPTI